MVNKKIFYINLLFVFTIILLLAPSIVNANIVCNDGTTSPSCETCHTGCCSGHNGCTDNPHYNDSNKKKNLTYKKNNKQNKGISKIDLILILFLTTPWIIAFLKTIFDIFIDLIKIIIEKIKK